MQRNNGTYVGFPPLFSVHLTTIATLVLPLPPHPSIPPGIENNKDLPASGFKSLMVALGNLHNPLLDWFRNHPTPSVAIVSDMFLGWTHHLACQLGIPRYAFSSPGALALSVIFFLWRYPAKRADP
ncbi:hypothetical protein L2E82_05296 [Cichorium intybus]|uniref:Uncharacterized protein n=1 Tax=Cichorium intybus TaxID=13427 RepID=A0ACB9H6L6_CICIN|nr:hypothetical protein L2E82_05296 [Cichorium intybus]